MLAILIAALLFSGVAALMCYYVYQQKNVAIQAVGFKGDDESGNRLYTCSTDETIPLKVCANDLLELSPRDV